MCNVIIHEENNEIEFEREFYEIWLRIQILNEEDVRLKSVQVKSFLVYRDQINNVKHSRILKLGEFQYLVKYLI